MGGTGPDSQIIGRLTGQAHIFVGIGAAPDVLGMLRSEITILQRRVTTLEREIKSLKQHLAEREGKEEVVILRDIPQEQAKEEFKALLVSGATLYMSEIADRLHLPDSLVVSLCEELLAEGEIQVNADLL